MRRDAALVQVMVRTAIVIAGQPSALLPMANRPLAGHAIHALARAGVERVAVAAEPSVRGELEGALDGSRLAVPDVTFVEQDGAGGLPALLAELDSFVADEPFVLHLGDSLNRSNLGPLLGQPGRRGSTVIFERPYADERVVELAHLRDMVDAPADQGPAAGVWVFGSGALDAIAGGTPSGSAELDAQLATQRLRELGGQVTTRSVTEWWRFRQRQDELLDGNRFVLEGLDSEPVRAQLTDTRIEGPVSIHPSARLASSVVRGPVVIGANASLRDAYVGPYSSIGEGVTIEGAEVENSIILAEASIRHVGGRLEASVVGARARVFRDFRLPRAMRLNVGEGAEVSLT